MPMTFRSIAINTAVVYCLIGLLNAIFPIFAGRTIEAMMAGIAVPEWYNFYIASYFLMTLALVLSEWRAVLALLRGNIPLIFLLFYMMFCTIWAIDPGKSFITAAKYFVSLFFGFYLVVRFSAKELLILLSTFMAVMILLSFYICWEFPEAGIHDDPGHEGEWRGVFAHKNILATIMNMGFIFFWCATFQLKELKWLWALFAVLSAVLIKLSGSGSGLALLSLTLAFPVVLPLLRSHGMILAVWAVTGCFLLGLLMLLVDLKFIMDMVFNALGKDATLTGRVDTWYGIFAFFYDYKNSQLIEGYGAQDIFYSSRGLIVPEADMNVMTIDSAYISVLVKYGVIGSIFFAIAMIHALIISIREVKLRQSIMSGCYVMMMMVILLNGVTKSLDSSTFTWVFLGLIFASPYIRDDKPLSERTANA